jgi:hypothetical protein
MPCVSETTTSFPPSSQPHGAGGGVGVDVQLSAGLSRAIVAMTGSNPPARADAAAAR